MRAAVPPVCVDKLGWITPAGAPACPGAVRPGACVLWTRSARTPGPRLPRLADPPRVAHCRVMLACFSAVQPLLDAFCWWLPLFYEAKLALCVYL